jgi:hypothetical protein
MVLIRSPPKALGDHLYQRLTHYPLCNLLGTDTIGTTLHSPSQLCYLVGISVWDERQPSIAGLGFPSCCWSMLFPLQP